MFWISNNQKNVHMKILYYTEIFYTIGLVCNTEMLLNIDFVLTYTVHSIHLYPHILIRINFPSTYPNTKPLGKGEYNLNLENYIYFYEFFENMKFFLYKLSCALEFNFQY